MQDQYETTTAFTNATRAVLTEIDIDQLPLPITLQPSDNGVRLQVADKDFDTWTEVLANATPLLITAPAHFSDGLGMFVEHVQVDGTVNGHAVAVITVREAAAAVDGDQAETAVAR